MARTDDEDRWWSERRFRSLVEATATEVFRNAPDGRLLSDMPRWRELTGQTFEEAEGFGWLDAVHKDDLDTVERAWRDAVARGAAFDAEYRIARAEGGWAHIWVRSAPLRDEAGEVVEYVGLYHDITERVERTAALEDALDRESQILRRVVEQTPVGVALLWGPNHEFRIFNRAFAAIVPDRQLLGCAVRDVMPEAVELVPLLDRARAGETVEVPEVAVPWGDGRRWYRALYSPVPDADGSPGGVLATAIEVTAQVEHRRGLERALEAERRVAEQLQRTLLPDALPDIPGVELCARYEPSADGGHVGGDWYDVFQAGDGRVVVAVGDVAGRGLQAATVMGQLRAALRAYAFEDPDPGTVLARMDDLVDRLGGSATLAYGLLSPESGVLLQGLAGHPPPLLLGTNGGGAHWLDRGRGTPLGAPPASRETAELLVPAGGMLLYYTDGLLQERELGMQAGLEALREAVAKAGAGSPALGDVCQRLLDAEGAGSDDDRAVLAVRRAGA